MLWILTISWKEMVNFHNIINYLFGLRRLNDLCLNIILHRLKTEANLTFLEEVMITLFEKAYVWQKNSESCHTSRRPQCCMWKNVSDNIIAKVRSPNSPDCNPLDDYVRGADEQETNKTPCCTKNELKARITAAFISLNKERIAGNSEFVWDPLLKLMAT